MERGRGVSWFTQTKKEPGGSGIKKLKCGGRILQVVIYLPETTYVFKMTKMRLMPIVKLT
jgi:hypothetical protein